MGLGWRLGWQLHAMERFCLGERLRRVIRLGLVTPNPCRWTLSQINSADPVPL
jgi:hypothetical protein